MKLEQSFEVDAPIEQVWTALIDLEKVAPCLPGAAITGHDEDGTYHGTFQVKLGPASATYRGTIRIESADAATHTATLAAKGSDKRGQGGASATIVNSLHATDGGGTRVDAATDFTITGRLASFGRGGMIKDISNRLLRDFAACLQQRLAGEPSGGDEPGGGRRERRRRRERQVARRGEREVPGRGGRRVRAAAVAGEQRAGVRPAGEGLLARALGSLGADPRPVPPRTVSYRSSSSCSASATAQATRWISCALKCASSSSGALTRSLNANRVASSACSSSTTMMFSTCFLP